MKSVKKKKSTFAIVVSISPCEKKWEKQKAKESNKSRSLIMGEKSNDEYSKIPHNY